MRLLAPTLDAIWKFTIHIEDEFTISMPTGSIPLSVGFQRGLLVLWAAVDLDARTNEQHRFYLRGTGHPLGNAFFHRFVGTVQCPLTSLEWHLFDGGPVEEKDQP